MKFQLFICLVISWAISNHALGYAVKPTVLQKLIQLVEIPTEEKLKDLKKFCTRSNNHIDFDGNSQALELVDKVLNNPNPIVLRALVYAAINCTDGASSEYIHGQLGNELLIKEASLLIQAIQDEDAIDRLKSIVELENNDWFAVECKDEKCKKERKAYFSKKRSALTAAKVPAKYTSTRERLLRNLKSDL